MNRINIIRQLRIDDSADSKITWKTPEHSTSKQNNNSEGEFSTFRMPGKKISHEEIAEHPIFLRHWKTYYLSSF